MFLTNKDRTECLAAEFKVIEKYMLDQLRMENFDTFGQQTADQSRIIGKIINVPVIGEKTTSLKEGSIGLIDLSDNNQTGTYRIKLNVSEVQSYALVEGAIVVAEGFMSNNMKFNVNRIH